MKKPQLEVLTEDEIKSAYDYQIEKHGWTFHDERKLTETTLHNRFNFLLVAYSLFTNAYFAANDNDKLTILFLALIIIFLLSIGIFRVYTRFLILMEILKSLDDKEALSVFGKEYRAKRIYGFSRPNAIIGKIVPILMIVSIIIGILFKMGIRVYRV